MNPFSNAKIAYRIPTRQGTETVRNPGKACAGNPWYIYNPLILNTPILDLGSDEPPDHPGCRLDFSVARLLRNEDRFGS
jgi:hypothetical protein